MCVAGLQIRADRCCKKHRLRGKQEGESIDVNSMCESKTEMIKTIGKIEGKGEKQGSNCMAVRDYVHRPTLFVSVHVFASVNQEKIYSVSQDNTLIDRKKEHWQRGKKGIISNLRGVI